MPLDRAAEILTWPMAELDPLRLSLRMQVSRIVFMIGMKAWLNGTLAREAARSANGSVFLPRRRGISGLPTRLRRPGAPGTGKPRAWRRGREKLKPAGSGAKGLPGRVNPLQHTRTRLLFDGKPYGDNRGAWRRGARNLPVQADAEKIGDSVAPKPFECPCQPQPNH
jgi:hypothetical protein